MRRKSAARAQPGSFAHLTCAASVPLRRPLSIMRADAERGVLEFLYKPVGAGLKKLAERVPGNELSVLAPIGHGFSPLPDRPRWLAIGGGVGIPPMIFLAERARARSPLRPVVLMGSEVPFPFELAASTLALRGVPAEASHAVTLLEGWQVPSRLASLAGLPGCYRGYVTELARTHLAALSPPSFAKRRYSAAGRDRCFGRPLRSRANSIFPASSRSRSTWHAESAAAPGARCCCKLRKARQ